MKKIFSITAMALILSVCVFTVPVSAQYFMMQNDLVGQDAEDFTLDTLKDKKVNFEEYRDGQKTVVFFWATWCPHCRVQLEAMTERKEEFKSKGIKVVAVNLGERKKQVARFIKKNKIEMDIFLDESGELEQSYQIIGLPTFYFIDEEGVITASRHSLPDDFEGLLSKK